MAVFINNIQSGGLQLVIELHIVLPVNCTTIMSIEPSVRAGNISAWWGEKEN